MRSHWRFWRNSFGWPPTIGRSRMVPLKFEKTAVWTCLWVVLMKGTQQCHSQKPTNHWYREEKPHKVWYWEGRDFQRLPSLINYPYWETLSWAPQIIDTEKLNIFSDSHDHEQFLIRLRICKALHASENHSYKKTPDFQRLTSFTNFYHLDS